MKNKIVFDVDGTLIQDINGKQIKREEVLDLMRAFYKLGWEIWVHSGGGIEYAARQVRWTGIDNELPIKIAPKGSPEYEYNIAVDDCLDEEDWTINKHGNYINAKYFINV